MGKKVIFIIREVLYAESFIWWAEVILEIITTLFF
jgi:hypothetical protein